MWDEKKFFEDYVDESHKIKPDEKFVQNLKQMAWQEEQKKKKIPAARYIVAAASLAVCICAGGVALHMNIDPKPGKTVEYDIKNRAGKADAGKKHDESVSESTQGTEATEESDSPIKSGTIGKEH